ncbi:MAG: RidA family protein [Rubrobacteraceae bacterium]
MIERIVLPELSPPPGYSHVVVSSGRRLVTTAGAVPLDAAGSLVGPGDRRLQTSQVLDNLMLALETVGAGADDVMKTTVYVVAEDRADLAAVWEVV